MQQCPVCGNNFRGRTDKRFCSDQCRSSFHNMRNRDDTNFMRQVNSRLRKNRRILRNLYNGGRRRVSRRYLADRGYNFECSTSVEGFQTDEPIFYNYEYVACMIDKHLVLVCKKPHIVSVTEYELNGRRLCKQLNI